MGIITNTTARTHSGFLVTLILILGSSILYNPLYAQNISSELNGSTTLTGQLWGIEGVGINLNHNINHRVSINAGIGVFLDLHLGAHIYLTNRKNKKMSFYLGTQVGTIKQVSIFGPTDDSQLGIYVPIGLEYIATRGFTFQVDVGPNFTKEDWSQVNTFPLLGSIKIGHTFRKK